MVEYHVSAGIGVIPKAVDRAGNSCSLTAGAGKGVICLHCLASILLGRRASCGPLKGIASNDLPASGGPGRAISTTSAQ